MCRNVAYIGLVAALTLPVGVAIVTAPSTRADGHTDLIVPTRASADLVNYTVDLNPRVNTEDLARVTLLVAPAGDVTLTSYPRLGTSFVQSGSTSFAPDLAAALVKAGISVHSLGLTRVAAAPEGERQAAAPDLQFGLWSGEASPAQPGTQSDGPSSLREQDATRADKPEEVVNWGAQTIGATDTATVPIAHALIMVGVIDTGIDDTRSDLVGRVGTSRSVSRGHNDIPSQACGSWRDDYFHGTHVAGVIAVNHNGIGIDGIAPTASLVSIKVSDDEQPMYPEHATCGLVWATNHDVGTVNNSYSMGPWICWSPSDPEQATGLGAAIRAIAYAQDKGLAVIAPVGNDGMDNSNITTDSRPPTDLDAPIKDRPVKNGVKVPAIVESVSQVSAAARTNAEIRPERVNLKCADFSNCDEGVDFTVSGQDIYSTVPTTTFSFGYAKTSGTFMATPHVMGTAAPMESIHPGFQGKQIIDLMRKQAVMEYIHLEAPEDGKEFHGYGFINALTTIRRDQPQPTIQTLQYRVGKGKWKDAHRVAPPAGPVTLYIEAIAPVSHLHMNVAGLVSIDRDGSGKYFGNALGASIESVDLSALLSEDTDSAIARIQVSAIGINSDRQADDDTGRETVFTVSRDPNAAVTPAPTPDTDATPALIGPTEAGITAPVRSNGRLPASYAVNLPRGIDNAASQHVATQASFHGRLVLTQYPALGTFFVQSASSISSPDLGAALVKEDISYDSIGPTRQAPVGGNEAMILISYRTRVAADAAIAAALCSQRAQGGRDAALTPDPWTDNGWRLQVLRALEAQGVDAMCAPVTVDIMDQSVDDTVPGLVRQIDHDKPVSCSFNGTPNRDPAA